MKKKIIIIVAIAVVVVAAVVGTVFGLSSLFSGDAGSKTEVSTPVSSEETANTESTESVKEFAGEASVKVGSAEASKDGIVKVPVTIEKNPGFVASLMTFTYDNTVIKYMGYEKGDVIKDYQFDATDNTVKFLNLENEDTDKTGTLFTLKFQVVGDSGKTSDVKLAIEDMINYDEKDIKTEIENGKVTVK